MGRRQWEAYARADALREMDILRIGTNCRPSKLEPLEPLSLPGQSLTMSSSAAGACAGHMWGIIKQPDFTTLQFACPDC